MVACVTRRLLLILLAALLASSASAQSVKRGLFGPAAAVTLDTRVADFNRLEALRFVTVDLDVFGRRGEPPDSDSAIELDVDLLRGGDGRPLRARPHRVEVLPSGRVAWTGHVDGIELSAVTFVVDRSAGT